MSLIPKFDLAPEFRPSLNIGATLDIPTGNAVRGVHNETLWNGGLGSITAVAGAGNSFKSATSHYQNLSAMSKVAWVRPTSLSTYDTEINTNQQHLPIFFEAFPQFEGRDLFLTGEWSITDRSVYPYGNKWFEVFKEFITNKIKDGKSHTYETPFLDRNGKDLFKMMMPTFGEIDSFSEFVTEDVDKMQQENEIGDSGMNTLHMRAALAKTAMLMQLPVLCGRGNHYLTMTSHMGKESTIGAGPYAPPPTKKLENLKNGDKLLGVTGKFNYLMSNCWHAYNTVPLMNQTTKAPEYPRENENDNTEMAADLKLVSLRQLRGKSGPTGITIDIIVSQSTGVEPSLTEFHLIKSFDRYGINGTMQHYALDLCPDIKLSRTTVRTKIDESERLRRALNITSEMLQLKQLFSHVYSDRLCTPKELIDDLTAKGYDWEQILATRGWYTLNNDKHPVPFLSTLDLLNMRAGTYTPYWLKK